MQGEHRVVVEHRVVKMGQDSLCNPPQPGPRAEEYNPRLPFVHALWHILSASSVATVNGLVEDVENEQLQKRLEMRPLGL